MYKILFSSCLMLIFLGASARENLPKDYLSKEFHARRREAFRQKMPGNSAAVLIALSLGSFAQKKEDPDRKEVLNKVQQFFDALELQDTVLFKSILLMEGETWAISEKDGSVKYSMRQFRDRLKTFVNPENVIQERMLGAEIKIHKRIAMAWVPYTLDISGKFSHCGIDVFTLLKTAEGWKIATVAFTVEPDGCDALKKEYPQN